MAQSGLATLFGWRGDKPRVPNWLDVDPTAEQQKAIAGNLENLPALEALGGKTNKAQAAQFLAMLDQLGLGNLFKQITSNLEDQSAGNLPKDVEDQVKRYAAEAGISTGTSGSDFNKYRSVRNLGLTSLDVSRKALDSAGRWLAQVSAGVPQFNFGSMFITPQQRIQTTFANQENKWQVDWMKNQLKALPSNEEQAYAQILDYVATFATQAAGMGMGSIGGGAGAGGGGSGGFTSGSGAGGGAYSYAERVPMLQQQYLNSTSSPAAYTPPAYQYPNTMMQPGGWGSP